MTAKLSAGMERFLEQLGGRVSMTKWDAAEKAAELIRAYEEERGWQIALSLAENDPATHDVPLARRGLIATASRLEALKSEIEKDE